MGCYRNLGEGAIARTYFSHIPKSQVSRAIAKFYTKSTFPSKNRVNILAGAFLSAFLPEECVLI
ncbi:MAG TPA: hypothetical protein V6C95_21165 [Coleofasciculaceae cyanobacterium]